MEQQTQTGLKITFLVHGFPRSFLFPIALLLFGGFPAIGWMPLVVMAGFAIAFNAFYPR